MSPSRQPPVLRLVLGDRLSRDIAALADARPGVDVVLMAEVSEEATYVRHHKAKLALVFSAMRHFAEELRAEGHRVDYVPIDDPANTGSLDRELHRAVARNRPARVVLTEAGEWRLEQSLRAAASTCPVPVEVRSDDRFLCSRAEFAEFAAGRRLLRMEDFYRWMRRRTGVLMEGAEPLGGRWNFDQENRRRYDGARPVPTRPAFPPDALTAAVLHDVERRFGDHFGSLAGFSWPVDRSGALRALDQFVVDALPAFGDYQDAMVSGAPTLFHSLLSPLINLGLLHPREVLARAEAACRAGAVPLASAEGFIRQILGWREYVRGVYWTSMPEYAQQNYFAADAALPEFYWSADTDLACLRAAITQTRDLAYAHHIQRLMLTGNFALLAGLDPVAVSDWYLAVYLDAYEWVELPNTLGMALHADGGRMATKPYCASGAYIRRMSDYCGGCRYDVKQRSGARACPFNYLYWAFLERNADRLRGNPRMALPYRQLDRMSLDERSAIAESARQFLAALPRVAR